MEEKEKIGHLEKRNERHYVLPSDEKGYKVLRYEYDLVFVSDTQEFETMKHVVDNTVVYDIIRTSISRSTEDLLYSFFDINRIRLISVDECKWLENEFFELTFTESLYERTTSVECLSKKKRIRETLPYAIKSIFLRDNTLVKDRSRCYYDDGTSSLSDKVSIILPTQSFNELVNYVKEAD